MSLDQMHAEMANRTRQGVMTFGPKVAMELARQILKYETGFAVVAGARDDGTPSGWVLITPPDGKALDGPDGQPMNDSHTCPPFTDCIPEWP